MRIAGEMLLGASSVLDSAWPERKRTLRSRRIGLGPAAVFGASKFPLFA